MTSLEIDHVIVAVRDLDAAAAEFLNAHGLRSVEGGRHLGHGTANRLIPLAGSYIELMTVVDAGAARESSLGRRVLDWVDRGDRPAALCLRTGSIADVASRLERKPHHMTRRNSDGTVLAWRLVGLDDMLGEEALPFFIEWDIAPGQHPAEIEVDHPAGAAEITKVVLGGDTARITGWVDDPSIPIDVVAGTPGVRRVELIVGGESVSIE